MSTGSSDSYSRTQFAKDLGLDDASRLDWAGMMVVANREFVDDAQVVFFRLASLITTNEHSTFEKGDRLSPRDINRMYRAWFCTHPWQWSIFTDAIVNHRQWTLSELMACVLVLVDREHAIPEVQGMFFDLALNMVTTADGCVMLQCSASTDEQARRAMDKIPDLLNQSKDVLLTYAYHARSPRLACEELVRRVRSEKRLVTDRIEELVEVYEACLPFADLSTIMEMFIREDTEWDPMIVDEHNVNDRVPAIRAILSKAPKDSALFAKALQSTIDFGMALRETMFVIVDFELVESFEHLLSNFTAPNMLVSSPHRPVGAIRTARELMLDAMEHRVRARDQAMTLYHQTQGDGGERFSRACALLRKYSMDPPF